MIKMVYLCSRKPAQRQTRFTYILCERRTNFIWLDWPTLWAISADYHPSASEIILITLKYREIRQYINDKDGIFVFEKACLETNESYIYPL